MAVRKSEQKLITGDELYTMGDIGPCELINGVIVPMSPAGDEHGAYEANVVVELRAFVDPRKLGKARTGDELRQWRALRGETGQVMQGLHLVPRLSARDNVVLGALAATHEAVSARLPTLPCATRLLVDVIRATPDGRSSTS